MPANPTPKRRPPTPEEITAQQRIDAASLKQRKADAARAAQQPQAAPARAVAVKPVAAPPAITPPDSRSPTEQYLDQIAPTSFPGQLMKYDGKQGVFVLTSDGEPIDTDRELVALCDETLIGMIKFSGEENVAPERVQGLLYSGFVMPDRATLGDTDEAEWPVGLSGAPTDPWLHQVALVLEDRSTHDLYTFATTSPTGRRAVGNLLKHFERLKRNHPDDYPVVRLKSGGFQHKDARVGFVHTPVFAVVGRAPKAAAVVPDGSAAADLNDEIPFK
jgi:hypothetical protein